MVRRKSNTGYKLRNTVAKTDTRHGVKANSTNSEIASNIRIVSIVQEVVIRGTIHQGASEFGETSRGRQCTANSAMAIIMCHMVQPDSWNKLTVDTVLRLGDKLYIDSIRKRKIPHGSEINREYLRVTELNHHVDLSGDKFILVINEEICIDGNIVHDTDGFPNLRNGLDLFFNQHSHGILTIRGMSIAIFKHAGFFWIFDSHARGPSGRQAYQGRNAACLMRFSEIQALYDLLACNFSLTSSDVLIDCQYSITPIYIVHDVAACNTGNTNLSLQRQEVVDDVHFHPQGKEVKYAKNDSSIVDNNECIVGQKALKREKTPNDQREEHKKVKKVSIIKEQFNDEVGSLQNVTQMETSDQCILPETSSMNTRKNSKKRKTHLTSNVQAHKSVAGQGIVSRSQAPEVCISTESSFASIANTRKKTCISAETGDLNSRKKRKNDENQTSSKRVSKAIQQTSKEDLQLINASHNYVVDASENSTYIGDNSTHFSIEGIDENWIKHERQFHNAIWNFANITCKVCNRVFYKSQTVTLTINDSVRSIIPVELHDLEQLIVCNRCATTIKNRKCPAQAYWNAMFLDPIPEVISCLTNIEKRLISMVVPFIKIIKLGGRFGQYGFKGQAVLFAQDVEEVIEQLPVSITSAGIAIVCEKLDNVTRAREFQVDVEKLWSALVWLKENNPLYRNVHIDYSNTNFDLSQICQVTVEPTSANGVRQEISLQNNAGMICIKNSRGILRGSFHQGDEHFNEVSRGKQGTANAAVAIVMAFILTLPSWTSGTVDRILINGDKLYTESIEKRNAASSTELNEEYLAVTELYQTIELLQNVYYLDINDTETVYGRFERDFEIYITV